MSDNKDIGHHRRTAVTQVNVNNQNLPTLVGCRPLVYFPIFYMALHPHQVRVRSHYVTSRDVIARPGPDLVRMCARGQRSPLLLGAVVTLGLDW